MLREHALSSFHFCPRCGTSGLSHLGERAIGCPQCGLSFYANVASAVACFVVDAKGQILSVRRGREPACGTLDLPGGFVDPLETVEEAVARELKEETRLEPRLIRYLWSLPNVYPYSGLDVYTADLFFWVQVDSFASAVAGDDASELVVMSLHEMQPELYGLHSIRRAVELVVASPERFQPMTS